MIVVGGGPGGVSCAALLVKRGLKTLVLDKNDRVSGKHKPSAKAPLPGLFYVGFDAGGGALMGTHQAVDSGMKVARLVLQYHLERKQAVWE